MGLKWSIDHLLFPIEVETDSTDMSCRSLLKKLENPMVRHIFRQSIKVADALAKQGSKQLTSSPSSFVQPPFDDVKCCVETQKTRIASTRLVSTSICNNFVKFDNMSIVTSTESALIYNIILSF